MGLAPSPEWVRPLMPARSPPFPVPPPPPIPPPVPPMIPSGPLPLRCSSPRSAWRPSELPLCDPEPAPHDDTQPCEPGALPPDAVVPSSLQPCVASPVLESRPVAPVLPHVPQPLGPHSHLPVDRPEARSHPYKSLARDGCSLVSRQTGLYRSIEDESLGPLDHVSEALRLRFEDAVCAQPIPAYNMQAIEAYTSVSVREAQRQRRQAID